MTAPVGWQNPIHVAPGHSQAGVNPLFLLPSRKDLATLRLDMQRALLDAGSERYTPIQVTPDAVIWDGHHAVRVAAEKGIDVTVHVVQQKLKPSASSIMDLKVG